MNDFALSALVVRQLAMDAVRKMAAPLPAKKKNPKIKAQRAQRAARKAQRNG